MFSIPKRMRLSCAHPRNVCVIFSNLKMKSLCFRNAITTEQHTSTLKHNHIRQRRIKQTYNCRYTINTCAYTKYARSERTLLFIFNQNFSIANCQLADQIVFRINVAIFLTKAKEKNTENPNESN